MLLHPLLLVLVTFITLAILAWISQGLYSCLVSWPEIKYNALFRVSLNKYCCSNIMTYGGLHLCWNCGWGWIRTITATSCYTPTICCGSHILLLHKESNILKDKEYQLWFQMRKLRVIEVMCITHCL